MRLVALMRTIALLGPRNGHTAIHPIDDHRMPQHRTRFTLHEFDDSVFVVAAAHSELVSAELVAVDGVDITEVLRAVTPLVAHDNEWTIRAQRPVFVVHTSVLRGLGVVDDDITATFRLRRSNGSTVNVSWTPSLQRTIGTVSAAATGSLSSHASLTCGAQRMALGRASADGRVIHVSYNVTLGNVSGFAREIEALAASARVGLVILDLRLNGGCDNRTYQPLLRSMERLSDTTRLAVLTSRMTFSAAMQLVVELERRPRPLSSRADGRQSEPVQRRHRGGYLTRA